MGRCGEIWGCAPHLGGVDVARKALILARTLGMALECVPRPPHFPPALGHTK